MSSSAFEQDCFLNFQLAWPYLHGHVRLPVMKNKIGLYLAKRQQEKFDDIVEIVIWRKLRKNRQCNDQKTNGKGSTMLYKALHRNLNIDHHEPHITGDTILGI